MVEDPNQSQCNQVSDQPRETISPHRDFPLPPALCRSLPPQHHLLLDLKLELMNDLAAPPVKSGAAVERALELLAERMRVLEAVDGGGESRLMGFLHFKVRKEGRAKLL